MLVAAFVCASAVTGCGRLGFDAVDGGVADGGDARADAADARADGALDGGDDGARPDGRVEGDAGDAGVADGVNLAFVSSVTVIPGELGSVTGADDRCTALANDAGWSGDFVAWLSSSTSNAVDRIAGSSGWQRFDGLLVATDIDDLTDRSIAHAINLDENGSRVDDIVVTATTATGQVNIAMGFRPAGTCGDFTDPDATNGVSVGHTHFVDGRFTLGGLPVGSGACDGPARLLCLGVGRVSTPVLAPDPTGRLAFIAPGWTPGGGFVSADAHCQREADAAVLSGTYRALLAGRSTSAAERFDLTGPTWYRVDGSRLARTPTALMEGRLDTSLVTDATGSVASVVQMWTGYSASGAADGTDIGTDTCQSWEVTGQLGARGSPSTAGRRFFDTGSRSGCSSSSAVACLQE